MKAISVLQPWATALLTVKDIENRTWRLPERYIGVPLALHASKRRDLDEELAFYAVSQNAGIDGRYTFDMHRGAVIGLITFSANVTESDSPWFFGPVGWVKSEVIALPHPIPCKGALSLWDVPEKIAEQIRQQIGGHHAE